MKKSRKFLSMLLAATMACSMSAMPAFADNQTTQTAKDTISNEGKVTPASTDNGLSELPFVKMLTTNDTQILSETTFNFVMEPAAPGESTKDGLPWKTGVELATSTATVTLTASDIDNIKAYSGSTVEGVTAEIVPGFTKTNVQAVKLDGKFSLALKSGEKFDENIAAVYHYKVSEVLDNKSSATINYDQKTYSVDLYVDNTGKITYAQSSTGTTKKPIVFENDFTTGSLTITKTVNGSNPTDPDKEFKFWIKIPTGGTSIDLQAGKSITAYKINGTAKTAVTNITVGGTKEQEENSSTANKTDDNTGWCSFTLKAGESLELTGLPAGMIYYLMEENYESENFDTYYISKHVASSETVTAPNVADYTDATKGGVEGRIVSTQYTKIEAGKNYIYYLNTHNVPTPTGIVVEILPYIAVVLAAAAALTVLLVFKKRRNAR